MKETIAAELFKAERDIEEVDKFTDKYPQLTTDIAYDIQELLVKKKITAEKTSISGWKLGLTSKAKQKMMGVHEPTYGVLLKSMQISEDEAISLKPFIHPKIEPEIAFVFDKELKGPVSVPEVLAATRYVAPALEIIDSRYRNFSFTLTDVIADNSSSSRYIIGKQTFKPELVDFTLMGMVFKKNGEVVATSTAASVMGHPARAIAWMVNKLTARGQSILPGQVVLSGALSGAMMMEAGDEVSVGFDGIGHLEVTITT
ncbi:fumarylacetoacetate hydrolase family protein [Bacillus aquiflavi]|uniref:4-oxalocrotonate decarboxylase n=1 Tax=Bacillus aquiflavi TaxID=2672567 RepID=A0A6B3VY99_9BACI|nr:fumarylacetoacetate hydrolase family protein [Bacillus aquiflavi]NEY82278.1 4-oxalocrotonate decarboxylase [Bacillus aquiflavi]UAC49932.1 fumarylacetoacetate hydrolase family protein [Bacillus aquiflavi]